MTCVLLYRRHGLPLLSIPQIIKHTHTITYFYPINGGWVGRRELKHATQALHTHTHTATSAEAVIMKPGQVVAQANMREAPCPLSYRVVSNYHRYCFIPEDVVVAKMQMGTLLHRVQT